MSITNSPNMSLPVPGVGNEDGPQWATDLNNCLSILDAHDHSAGNGVAITPSGINISSNLPFNGYSATTLLSTVFSSQSSALAGTNFCSVIGGNLYFNDGSGNQIPITSGGGVAGSPGSIGGLASPASASYTAGSKLFTWRADSGKAAAMDNGAVTIRETNVASAKGITLLSPTALAADYNLTLPAALPASSQYMACSSIGVTSFVSADTIGAAMTSVGSNAIQASTTRSTGTTVGVGGVALSATCGSFSSSSTSFVDVTNLSVVITTSGRPVFVGMIHDANTSDGSIFVQNTIGSPATARISIMRDATKISDSFYGTAASGVVSTSINVPLASISSVDVVTAGTYTYKIQGRLTTGSNFAVSQAKLVAYEL